MTRNLWFQIIMNLSDNPDERLRKHEDIQENSSQRILDLVVLYVRFTTVPLSLIKSERDILDFPNENLLFPTVVPLFLAEKTTISCTLLIIKRKSTVVNRAWPCFNGGNLKLTSTQTLQVPRYLSHRNCLPFWCQTLIWSIYVLPQPKGTVLLECWRKFCWKTDSKVFDDRNSQPEEWNGR